MNHSGCTVAELALEARRCLADPAHLRAKIARDEQRNDPHILGQPKPDPFAYWTTLYRGFVRYPARLENYVLAINNQREAQCYHQPILIDVELTSRCNFRCTMCQVSEWPNGRRAPDLPFDEFRSLIDANLTLTEVKLQGMGEPLLHRDFFNMIDYMFAKDIWIRTTLNGSLLHARDNYRRLVDSGIGEVQISLDGATKDIYESIRRRANFDLVTRNIALLNNYADRRQRSIARMWVTVQRRNRHQILELADLAVQLGFRRLTYSMNLGGWGQNSWEKTNRDATADALTEAEQDRLAEIKLRDGLDITIWGVSKKYSTQSPNALCPAPFLRSYVSSDMRLVPCGGIGNPQVCDLGPAAALPEQWNSKKYQGFRKAHLTGNIPKYCQACYRELKDG